MLLKDTNNLWNFVHRHINEVLFMIYLCMTNKESSDDKIVEITHDLNSIFGALTNVIKQNRNYNSIISDCIR